MAKKLTSHVGVTSPDGEYVVFGPDDTLPAWARSAITNPKAWAEPDEDESHVELQVAPPAPAKK